MQIDLSGKSRNIYWQKQW